MPASEVECAASAAAVPEQVSTEANGDLWPEYNAEAHFFLPFINDDALEPIPDVEPESLTSLVQLPKLGPNSRIIYRTKSQSDKDKGILPDMGEFRRSTALLRALGVPNECEYSASMELGGDSVLMAADLEEEHDYYQFRRFIVETKITAILDETNKTVHFVAKSDQLVGELADSPHKYPVKVLGRIDVESNAANQTIGGSIKIRVARAHRDTDEQAYVACCAYEMDWKPPADFKVPCDPIKHLADRYIICWYVSMLVPAKKVAKDSWSPATFRIAIRNTTKGDSSAETVNIECEDPISASDFVLANTILAWYYDQQLQKYTKLRPLLDSTKHDEVLQVAAAQGISETQIQMLASLSNLRQTKQYMTVSSAAAANDGTKTTLDDDQRRQLGQWLSEHVVKPRLAKVLQKGSSTGKAKATPAETTAVADDGPVVVEGSCRLTPPNSPLPTVNSQQQDESSPRRSPAHSQQPDESSPRRSPRRRNSQSCDGPGQKSTRRSD